jgi:GNAT superfamily N-acetyltransferase
MPERSSLSLRPLTEQDAADVQSVIESDSGYVRRVTGIGPRPEDALELLTAGPPGLQPGQKVVLGAFEGDSLVAVVDLLRDWPERGTSHIGLLQVHADHQGRGLGRRVHDALLSWAAADHSTTTLRAAIVETNAKHAAPYWAAMGYTPRGQSRPYQVGTLTSSVTIWTRRVRK